MRLVVERGELAGREFTPKRTIVMIGREQESDIVLTEQGVSRRHATLSHGPQGWTLADLGSTNGTSINGQLLRSHQVYLLQPGDRIAIGSSVFAVQEQVAAPESGPTRRRARRHPALLVAGALLLVIALAGIVAVLVTVLQPQEELTIPTPMNQVEQLITALPVPTEFQIIITSVVPLIPTGLPLLPLGGTATPPPPGAAIPGTSLEAHGNGASP